jgi:hypothetical protein
LLNSKEILKFEFIQKSKRTYKKINIKKPNNTTTINEVLNIKQ